MQTSVLLKSPLAVKYVTFVYIYIFSGTGSECKICKKMFTSRSFLLRHVKYHCGNCEVSVGPYSCEVCGETFNGPGFLTVHLKLFHTATLIIKSKNKQWHAQKPNYQRSTEIDNSVIRSCENNQIDEIRPHLKSLTINILTENIQMNGKNRKCGKAFTHSSALTTNPRTNSGVRPYECKQCGKTFTQSCKNESHLRTHSW